jgi:predicted nucleic acid-binding protein
MNASNILVDSFAWLEVLNGSDRGKIAPAVMKESNKVFTSVLNIYEIKYGIEQNGIRDEESDRCSPAKDHRQCRGAACCGV